MTATDGMFEGTEHYAGTGLAHAYASEDLRDGGATHPRPAVPRGGGQPAPYIVVKDAALNAMVIGSATQAAIMKYSLGAPFTSASSTWR